MACRHTAYQVSERMSKEGGEVREGEECCVEKQINIKERGRRVFFFFRDVLPLYSKFVRVMFVHKSSLYRIVTLVGQLWQ